MSILKIKDSQGNWVGVPTVKGDTGNGISSAVLNNDYTLTLIFTDGTTYTTPSIRGEKGEQGEPATDMEIHICSITEYDVETRMPTIENPNDKTFYLVPTEDGTSPDLFTEWVYVNNAWEMFGSAKIDLSGYLMDVKVNGISVTNDGIANIPLASTSNAGAIQIGTGLTTYNNRLIINPATQTLIKVGSETNMSVTPYRQHESTFYGLAKASGTDEKNSTLPVGQYTDEAKSSIQDMLDVPSNADLDEMEEKVEQNTEDLLKAFPVEIVSGNIASFEDGANDIPLQSLVVDINPVQDLHGYDNPWVGGAGRNLFGLQGKIDKTFAGVTYTSTEDYLICNGKKYGANLMSLSEASFVLSAGTYYVRAFNVSGSITSGSMSQSNMCLYDSSDTRLLTSLLNAERELILAEDTTVYFGFALNDNIEFSDYTIGIVVSKTNGITEFTPYENICPISGWEGMTVNANGTEIPISWQTKAGTVYGGKLDVLSGVLRVIKKCDKVSNYNWSLTSGTTNVFRASISYKEKDNANVISSDYGMVSVSTLVANMPDGTIKGNINYREYIYIKDSRYTTGGEFKEACGDVQICYDLFEPIEIQLTPHKVNSLLGVNNIFADAGDTSVEYRADPDLYIQRKMPEVPVDDVQINGTSIVTDGVANIPHATDSTYGVIHTSSSYGTSILDGTLSLVKADDAQVKAGTTTRKPIVPINQHSAVFYGLAKASGDTTQSQSNNAVGTYTDEAKSAIKQMLGVHDAYDSFIVNVEGTDPTITGQPSYRYNCGEVLSLTVTPPETGTIDFRFTSGSSPTVLTLPSTVKMPEWWVEVEANTIYEMCITDGVYCGVMSWAM